MEALLVGIDIFAEAVISVSTVIGCWNVIWSPTVIGELPSKRENDPVDPVTVPLELILLDAII